VTIEIDVRIIEVLTYIVRLSEWGELRCDRRVVGIEEPERHYKRKSVSVDSCFPTDYKGDVIECGHLDIDHARTTARR